MNKTILASALLLVAGIGSAQAAQISAAGYATTSAPVATTGNNFTMLGKAGGVTGGTNDVSMTWDGTVFNASTDYTGPGSVSNMTLSSPTLFFSYPWVAHDVQVFAPGTFTFDTTLGGGNAETGIQTLTVGAGQLGAHMLFDWGGASATTSCGKANCNIDVSVLWNPNAVFGGSFYAGATNTAGNSATTVWNASSIDGDGNGIMGISMNAGGPFGGFNANFNLQGITPNAVPVPAAVWLLGSGLLGLVGVARRKKTA